jgi:hypothetical protein
METNTKTQSPTKTGVTTSGLNRGLIDSPAGKYVSPTGDLADSIQSGDLSWGPAWEISPCDI